MPLAPWYITEAAELATYANGLFHHLYSAPHAAIADNEAVLLANLNHVPTATSVMCRLMQVFHSCKKVATPLLPQFDYWSLGMTLAFLLALGNMDLLLKVKQAVPHPGLSALHGERWGRPSGLEGVRMLLEGLPGVAGAVAVDLVVQLLQPDMELRPSFGQLQHSIGQLEYS